MKTFTDYIDELFERAEEEDERDKPDRNIVMQARKAVNMGGKKVTYDDGKNWKSWDGTNVNYLISNPLRPYVFSQTYGLLHSHSTDFPKNLGKALQVNMLKKYNLDELQVIKGFVEKFENKNVLYELKKHKFFLKIKLLMYLDFNKYNNNLYFMKNALNDYKPYKYLFYISYNLFKFIFNAITKNKYELRIRNKIYPLVLKDLYHNKIKQNIKN